MPSNTHTIIGGTKRLECRVIGHPRPEIRWFKDGRDITDNERYSFHHSYEGVISMILENISHRDEGHYRCRAENTEGIASTSAYLHVKAHKEHPDEEIEEVHSMDLEEHIVYKSNRAHTIMTDFPGDRRAEMDAAQRRTFEQIVDEEKENVKEILVISKDLSSKKSSESSTVIENVKEQSKKTLGKYEETLESSSKRSLIISEENTSLSFQSEIESLESSRTKKSKEESLSLISSMEETKVKADMMEKEMVMKVSVETEQSSSTQSKSGRLTTTTSISSTEAEISEKSKGQDLSVEVTGTETSSTVTKKSAKDLLASASTEEVSTESSRKSGEKQTDLVTSITTEESSTDSSRTAGEKEQKLIASVTTEDTSTTRKAGEKEQKMITSITTDEMSTESSSKVEGKQTELTTSITTEQVSTQSSSKDDGKQMDLVTSVTTEETSTESSRKATEKEQDVTASISTEGTATESSRTAEGKPKKLAVDVDVEEVAAECRMELESRSGEEEGEGDSAKSVTDSTPTSLCNDSGFMESSVLDSTQFQTDSMLDSAMESSALDTASADSETDTKPKFVQEIRVEESQGEGSVTSEASEITSLMEESEKLASEENVAAATSTASIARKTSLVREITSEDLAETTKTTSVEEETKASEEVIRRESTSVSQEISHADETVENISGGDITGLLDETAETTTVVEEEEEAVVAVVEAEEDQQDQQRTRWVDQITSRTEALAIEGEGKKVEELTAEEAAVATQTKVDQVELSRTTSETEPETSVDAENLMARQPSVVDDLSIVQEQLATVDTEVSSKHKKGFEERMEVDEELSAKNVLGLQKAPTSTFGDELGSSVDSFSRAGKEAEGSPEAADGDEAETVKVEVSTDESKKKTQDEEDALAVTADVSTEESKKKTQDEEDALAVTAEVSTEESKKVRKEDEELRLSADISVSEKGTEGEGRSAPRLVAVPEDVSVQLGQTVRLVSQVQGNPQPEVKWFKDGDSVRAGQRVTLQTADHDVFTLEIREVEEGDAGTYTLTAHNAEGTIFSDALVTVTIPPSLALSPDGAGAGAAEEDDDITLRASVSVPEIVAQEGKVTVKDMGTLELVCTIKGTPSPTVEWSKAGQSLQSDSHRSVFESEGQYHLTVPRVTVEDAGDYTCTASNSEGSVTCTISVFVERPGSSVSEDGASAMVPLSQLESSSDVSTADSATTRYLKLIAAAAAFSLAAFGVKKVVESLPK